MSEQSSNNSTNNSTYTINPYSLLGLTPLSTLAEAKKSYYNWALLCHPDRGGKKEEMIVVKNAYDYIKKQLIFVQSKEGNTYEKLEEEFQDFCKNQESQPPPFSAIYEETNDWIKDFNKEFEEKKKSEDFNPFNLGYGDLMDKSEKKETYDENEEKKVSNTFSTQIVEYKEPQYLPDTHEEYPLNLKKIDDFTSHGRNIVMTDYKKAFSPKPEIDTKSIEQSINKSIEERYEEQLKLRNININ